MLAVQVFITDMFGGLPEPHLLVLAPNSRVLIVSAMLDSSELTFTTIGHINFFVVCLLFCHEWLFYEEPAREVMGELACKPSKSTSLTIPLPLKALT